MSFCCIYVESEFGRPFKSKKVAGDFRGFARGTFGTSFSDKNAA